MRRRLRTLVLGLAALLVALIAFAAPAQASHGQVALFEDDGHLATDPSGTMSLLRQMGVGEARVYLEWSFVAPDPYSFTKPANFDSASPARYSWSRYDNIVTAARQNHIALDIVLSGGAPHWAIGRDFPTKGDNIHYAWKPSATEFGNFVHAVLLRYGHAVHTWELYNEPNFGDDLAPQSVRGVATGPAMYRGLLDAAWRAFTATHHTHDTIIIGQLTARGLSGGTLPGNFSQTKPLIFTRDLYCLNTKFRPLTGRAAKAIGCPTTAAGSRSFTRLHPGLFHAAGFGIHPYPQGLPPTRDSSRDPDYITFNTIPRTEAALDAIDRTYHVHGGLQLYNNEYGYVTRPPATNPVLTTPANAAIYINQAEYLSWLNPRIQSYMQYLLYDPAANGPSQFFSGLIFPDLTIKPSFYAFRMPVWLPAPHTPRGKSTEVWGAVRPFHAFGGRQPVQIQWRANSRVAFRTVARVALHASNGYFDAKVRFPASGQVQTLWNEPGIGPIASRITPVKVS